jgi:hypothetical protein
LGICFEFHISAKMSILDGLLDGFTAAGGWYNEDVFALQEFPDMDVGAVALRDISVSA